MYEIGQWVVTDEGIGQIIWVRAFSECKIFKLNDYRNYEIDDSGNYLYKYIIKYFCSHDFQILKKFHIASNQYPNKINEHQFEKLSKLKNIEKKAYYEYIIFDQFHLPVFYWELFFIVKKEDMLSIKHDLSDFKNQYKGNYFNILDLDSFLKHRKSVLCLENPDDRSSLSLIDKKEFKILVLQFFTTTENKIVNGNVCLIDFNNLWR